MVRVEPGEQTVNWPLHLAQLPDGLYAVGMTAASSMTWRWQWPARAIPQPGNAATAGLEWRCCTSVPCGCHTLVLDPDHYHLPQPGSRENLYLARKDIMLAPAGEDTRWVRERTNRTWEQQYQLRDFLPVPVIETTPVLRPYAAAQATSGCSHTDCLPELWISDPAQALPQTLELTWATPRAIGEVRLVFDTDLDMNDPAFEPLDILVKAYRVEARCAGTWREVARETDNRVRFRVHRFAAVSTEALRLVVEAVHAGGRSARVFEMRCY
jgi:hypothetical protein